MLRNILIVVAVFFTCSLIGQTTKYHRSFPIEQLNGPQDPDTSHVLLDGIQLRDGSYLCLSGVIPVNDSVFSYLLLTQVSPKGELGFTKKIQLPNEKIFAGQVSLIQTLSDSLLVSFSKFRGDDKHHIAKLSKNGRDLKIKQYSTSIDGQDNQVLTSEIVQYKKDSLIRQIAGFLGDESPSFHYRKLNKSLEVIDSKLFDFKNGAGDEVGYVATNFKAIRDGGITTGASSSPTSTPAASLINFNGLDAVKWARIYNTPEAQFISISVAADAVQAGKDFYVAGQYWDLNPFDLLNSYLGSFVMKLDSTGKVVWSKKFNPAKGNINTISNLALQKNGEIILTGSYLKGISFNQFVASISGTDGKVNWMKEFDRENAAFTYLGSIFPTNDGGLGLFYNEVSANDNLQRMSFAKMNDKGETGCEKKGPNDILVNHKVLSDTLILKDTKVTDSTKNVTPYESNFNNYDIAVLGLEFKDFCPNEKVDWTFKATLTDAIKYKWSDGSSADTLRVFDVGQYSVTITIDTLHCFEICDTVELKRTNLPSITALSGPKVCVGAPFIVTSSFTADSPVTSVWSTGATNVGSITATTLGTYSVTITDQCGDKASSSIAINESIYFGPPSGAITRGPTVCKDAKFTLSAQAAGGGGGPYTFKWSNGETTSEISPTALGVYQVTVTDKCGLTGTASINVTNDVWFKNPSAAIAKGPLVCKDKEFILNADGSGGGGGPYTYKWSSGQTTAQIKSTTLGPYTVTVTDKCGLTASVNTTIGNEIYFGPPLVEIQDSKDNTYCLTGKIGLDAIASSKTGSEQFKYSWSNNQTTPTALVEGNGTYTVTVTDNCGLTATAQKIVSNIGEIPSCLKLPKIFMPDNTQLTYLDNAYFYAINQCGADSTNLKDFELKVFNRWGQEVFSSTKLSERWDGRNNDNENYPPDVYVWYVRYSVGQFCKVTEKGDVNLFRRL